MPANSIAWVVQDSCYKNLWGQVLHYRNIKNKVITGRWHNHTITFPLDWICPISSLELWRYSKTISKQVIQYTHQLRFQLKLSSPFLSTFNHSTVILAFLTQLSKICDAFWKNQGVFVKHYGMPTAATKFKKLFLALRSKSRSQGHWPWCH